MSSNLSFMGRLFVEYVKCKNIIMHLYALLFCIFFFLLHKTVRVFYAANLHIMGNFLRHLSCFFFVRIPDRYNRVVCRCQDGVRRAKLRFSSKCGPSAMSSSPRSSNYGQTLFFSLQYFFPLYKMQ